MMRQAREPFEAKLEDGAHSRVVVRGEIDIATAGELERSLLAAADRGGPVEIDLRDTTFIDSTGLSALIRLATTMADPPDPALVVLAAPQPAVRKTLMVSGLDRIVTIREN